MQGKPAGMHTITPHITLNNAAKAIEFYKNAFGAEELHRSLTPDGRIMHATIRIGDSNIMLNDEFPEWGSARAPQGGKQPFVLNIYLEKDIDSAYDRAVRAGAKAIMPLSDMFWGDRYGQLEDPFGYTWAMAMQIAEVSPEEAEKKGKEMFEQVAHAGKL